ncbi:MAG: hypothetical protein ABI672_09435 [Vicinamibacteria bacterium]
MTPPSALKRRLRWAALLTVAMILAARQWRTIGGRVPMVFVGLWFGSATMVALVFSPKLLRADHPRPAPPAEPAQWRASVRLAGASLLPLALVPLLERHGVQNDPAVWLLDCALVISLLTVPYFTLLARSVLGGVVLSIGAFQALWTGGASALFIHMQALERQRTGQMPRGWTFEDFFRPEYRHLFYILTAVMVMGYCPALFCAAHQRFKRTGADLPIAAVIREET